MQEALIFLVKTLTNLYLLTYLLRFVLQWVHVDYYNPLVQFVFKITNSLVVPTRRLIPSAGGVDVATLLVLVLLEGLATWIIISLVGVSLPFGTFLIYVVLRLVSLTLWFYSIAILIYVILSWIAPGQYNPIARLLDQLVEPVLRPARRILPPIGGFDLSPLLVLILIQALVIALPLPGLLR